MKCGACKKSCRRTFRAFVPADARGKVKGANVCGDCLARAVVIVPSQEASLCSCGAVASFCTKCVDVTLKAEKRRGLDANKVAKKIRAFSKAYDSMPSAYSPDYMDGIISGLEKAAHLVEMGEFD